MIVTKEVDYIDGDTLCRGFMAYDNEAKIPLPAVMIAHDWGGRSADACSKAKKMAALGYVGFAIDMYGQASLGHTKEEKRTLMTPLRQDRTKLSNRILAAFNTVASLEQVDKTRIAAIGYCFGGLCVLDLARAGVDIKGVVSFHGLLEAPKDAIVKEIPAKILILHGYDDPLVSPKDLNHFALEMTQCKADCYLWIDRSFFYRSARQ